MLRTREEAAENGFAVFNRGPHLCVDVPDGGFTITCKNSEGKKVTFAFCPKAEPQGVIPGHNNVDIVHHSHLNARGIPIQQAAFLTAGSQNAVTNYDDEDPTTVVSVSLKSPGEVKKPGH